MKRFWRRPFIDEETQSVSCGAASIDVVMARRHGWSDKAIERAYAAVQKVSRRESALAHRNGPVQGCPCVVCDPKVADELTDNARCRAAWRRRGLWPVNSKRGAAPQKAN